MPDFIEIVPVQAITSPCVNICEIDETSGLCIGCRRTIDEIATWTAMSDVERDAVMVALPERAL